ncbi:uncharacterized protein [Aquarana catesbeiana]|uniref:uncharacterized protein n=1 Tax=Aquarana catesbeiana TaxID=8400 RepID=UPI003CC953D2
MHLRLTHTTREDCSLVISPLLMEDSGTYEINVAVNGLQSGPIRKFNVHVIDSPLMTAGKNFNAKRMAMVHHPVTTSVDEEQMAFLDKEQTAFVDEEQAASADKEQTATMHEEPTETADKKSLRAFQPVEETQPPVANQYETENPVILDEGQKATVTENRPSVASQYETESPVILDEGQTATVTENRPSVAFSKPTQPTGAEPNKKESQMFIIQFSPTLANYLLLFGMSITSAGIVFLILFCLAKVTCLSEDCCGYHRQVESRMEEGRIEEEIPLQDVVTGESSMERNGHEEEHSLKGVQVE